MKSYSLASNSWDQRELEAIQKVIDSGMYTMGNNVAQFEKDFAKFAGSKYCVMVNSGSSANLLAVASLFYTQKPKLKRGDEVVVPAVSWATTFFPLQQYGLKLKFADIDLETLNYDLHELKKAVSDSTKMIMAVNLLGNPNDFDEIQNIINGRDIILFEDNCESMGATYKNKQAGTFGLLGTFSSFFSHHIATMEGGLIVTDDEELYHVLLCLRAHGWTRNLPKENKITHKSDNPFEESFRFILPGYNVRPLEMSGAIGIEQLKKLPDFLRHRRNNAKLFCELFADSKDYIIQKDIDHSSWFGFSLIIKPHSTKKRADILQKLTANNIEHRPIVTGNFAKNEVLKYFDYEIVGKLPNANYMDQYGFFVGNHQFDITPELNKLYELIK